ncbi:hypothetical protein ACFQI5_06930 [Mammaliicoccus vitulinus]
MIKYLLLIKRGIKAIKNNIIEIKIDETLIFFLNTIFITPF